MDKTCMAKTRRESLEIGQLGVDLAVTLACVRGSKLATDGQEFSTVVPSLGSP
jgi:hypothetical protein